MPIAVVHEKTLHSDFKGTSYHQSSDIPIVIQELPISMSMQLAHTCNIGVGVPIGFNLRSRLSDECQSFNSES